MTNINKRITQAIQANSNIKLIEVNLENARNINENTLKLVDEKNVRLDIVHSPIDLRMHEYRTDCFAYHNKQCTALTDINCRNCRFYNNKLNQRKIEWDIEQYALRKDK